MGTTETSSDSTTTTVIAGLPPNAKRVVLCPHSAVGESVILSGLARLYHKTGFKVYVDPHCDLTNNSDVFNFLFINNPYISGFRTPSSDDLVHGVRIHGNPPSRSVLDPKILTSNCFTAEERKLKLFYEPQMIFGLGERTLVDLNISTYRQSEGGRDDLKNVVDYVIANYPDAHIVEYAGTPDRIRPFSQLDIPLDFERVRFSSIYDYCDLLFSCKRMVCLQTGSEMFACHYCKKVDCLITEDFVVRLDDPNRLVWCDTDLTKIDIRCWDS